MGIPPLMPPAVEEGLSGTACGPAGCMGSGPPKPPWKPPGAGPPVCAVMSRRICQPRSRVATPRSAATHCCTEPSIWMISSPAPPVLGPPVDMLLLMLPISAGRRGWAAGRRR